MKDTSPETAAMLERLWAGRSPGERMQMACAMFTTARLCARAGIALTEPGLSEGEIRVREFRRFHGVEFDAAHRERIESRIRAWVNGDRS